MAYFNSWEDLRKQPYYADLSDDELKELWESFKMDPATALRVARNTAHSRQEANKDKAIEDFYQAQDALDRNFNPESYAMRRSGLGKISMPVGGRAGMANLHRPQYVKDMNQSVNAPGRVLAKKEALGTANTLEAEREESKGWLRGSEQHRAKLEKSIGDYDREIAKLQAEIALSEAGDPMYDLAVMRMIMDDDMSLMNDIRGRIGKKIDQEFQMKQKNADQEFQHNENELNRENTLEAARMNKQEQDAAKKQDLEDAAERAADVYMSLKRKLSTISKDDSRYSEVEDQLDTAKILMKQAYRKAGKLSEYDEITKRNKEDDKTLGELKTLLYRMHGATSDDNFKDIYTAADAEQRKVIDHDAELLNIPVSKLPIAGIKGVSDIKNEQNDKAKKKKADFQNANKTKKFEINILTGKPKDPQAAESWLKKAREAGWTNIEIQSNGVPLWK